MSALSVALIWWVGFDQESQPLPHVPGESAHTLLEQVTEAVTGSESSVEDVETSESPPATTAKRIVRKYEPHAAADNLGLALLKATFDCGFENSDLKDVVNSIFKLEGMPEEQLIWVAKTLAKAGHLAEFCR